MMFCCLFKSVTSIHKFIPLYNSWWVPTMLVSMLLLMVHPGCKQMQY
jgi:hypothetical protein